MERHKAHCLARHIQDVIVEFINHINRYNVGCMSRDIEVSGYMLIFHDEKTWQKFIDVFDILGMDFTTGEPDGEYQTWYIDFEFCQGISE